MSAEKSTKEVKVSTFDNLSQKYCDKTFKNILRGKNEDVIYR
jgi:hypothetical protein